MQIENICSCLIDLDLFINSHEMFFMMHPEKYLNIHVNNVFPRNVLVMAYVIQIFEARDIKSYLVVIGFLIPIEITPRALELCEYLSVCFCI